MPSAPIPIAGLAGIAFAALIGCSEAPLTTAAQESAQPQSQPEESADMASTQSTDTAAQKHTNRLVNETSPYLLQHAHNPVDWYPWGEEALAKAKAEDKPIFLSVGYSSCHWCHVMERESFENEEIAAVMNAHFINVKVDREERPDIDEIYMTAVQAMTGSGGWPMSVWLTPELEPFYGGTYFPPDNRYGRPGFKAVLQRIATVWQENRSDLIESASRLTEHMEQLLTGQGEPQGEVTDAVIAAAMVDLRQTFDARDGGFGGAPKFPSAPSIQVLLREYNRTGEDAVLQMATLTLDKMAAGGMYDHLGGGFARYSTDAQWLVPHFEKMLYDNGQLAQAYLEAYQVTGDPSYRRIVEETFTYILRDMRDERGGFHSAEDADSEDEEGKFYIWDHDEIVEVLGADDAAYFNEFYNVQPDGNFSSHEPYHAGKNILHITTPIDAFAAAQGQRTDEALTKLAAMRERLLEVRNTRVRPGLDDKVLTSWNALMISAFAQGYQILRDPRYRDAATEAAHFIMTDMMREGELLRTHRHGESRLPAYLDDYSFMIAALLDVYEATFDVRWIEHADALAKTMIAKFWDAEADGFYFTSDDHKNLLVRTRPTYDGAIPSGNSMAALGLLRLAKFIDSPEYYDKARQILESNAGNMRRVPRGFIKMIVAADFMLYPPKEIALAGEAGSEGISRMLSALHGAYVPNKLVAFVEPDAANADELAARMPLLAGKRMIDGKATAYVCKDFACKRPVTEVEAFLEQLEVSDRKDGDA